MSSKNSDETTDASLEASMNNYMVAAKIFAIQKCMRVIVN